MANQNPEYTVGTVTNIVEETEIPGDGDSSFYIQTVAVELPSGEVASIEVGSEFQPLNPEQRLEEGRQIIVAINQLDSDQATETTATESAVVEPIEEASVADIWRAPSLIGLFVMFTILVVAVSRWQGLRSIIGMALSLAIIVLGLIPALLAGYDPVLVSVIASVGIGTLTVYLSHGWSLKSHISAVSIGITLLFVSLLASWAVDAAQIVGLGSEEAAFLQYGQTAGLNLQGLLLGGIILGALGVLDDITVSQVSTLFQLKKAKPEMGFEELIERGLEVGRDHVASLVNTLVLAYSGANLPLFLLFALNESTPHWVTLNREIIAEEVVRTLVGSIGLVIAVPITTLLAAWVCIQLDISKEESHGHIH